MKIILLIFSIALSFPFYSASQINNPLISGVTYSEIEYYSVKILWKTDVPCDSKVKYMKSDSNYQAINYTDSIYNPSLDTIHSVTLTFLDPHTLYNFNITSSCAYGETTTQNSMFATKAATEGTIKIYFTKSIDTTVSSGVNATGNIDPVNVILERLPHSHYYLDVAVDKFEDCDELTTEILKAKRDGTVIRFIYGGSQPSRWIDTLKANGVKVINRKNDGHKLNTNFWIFDARCTCSGGEVYVLTSTGQITNADRFVNKNSSILMKDRTVAYIYTREFDEMWGSFTDYPDTVRGKFGSMKKDNVPHKVNMNGVYADIYFTPSDSLSAEVIKYLNKATSKLYFAAYDFSSSRIYNSFYQLRNQLQIKGIFDNSNSNSGVYNIMKTWGAVIKDTTAGSLSHNYIITDMQTGSPSKFTMTGSYRWTDESNYFNDEDMLIFYDPQISNQYFQEYHSRYRDITGNPMNIIVTNQQTPKNYSLSQNYPNPFNPVTKIKFEIPESTNIQLIIYDALGRKINTLIDSKLNSGNYTIDFNGENLSSGIYYYSLIMNGKSITKKMLLIK